jgi:hypothetical protein
MLLAVIRGDLFMQEFETMTAPVVIDDGEPAMSQPQPSLTGNIPAGREAPKSVNRSRCVCCRSAGRTVSRQSNID